jgi:hypothetical protein
MTTRWREDEGGTPQLLRAGTKRAQVTSMRKRALTFLVVCAAVALHCVGQDATVPQELQSLSDGFYYQTSRGWQKLEPLAMAGGGLKYVGKMLVPGLTPQMVWTFRDAESPAQIEDRRPAFCIKELAALANIGGRSRRDLLIVRFDKKKDHRELQTTNGGNMFTFKAGLSKDRMPEITTKTLADGIFMVTPNEDLKPGEYMITFSALGNSGYDFGIR